MFLRIRRNCSHGNTSRRKLVKRGNIAPLVLMIIMINKYILWLILGEASVPVAECDKVEFQSHPKKSMLFKDYVDYWKSCDQKSKLSQNGNYGF